jgi:DNA-binding CsgD family transcriptional regulator
MTLTFRQEQIMALICEGLTYKEISRRLHIEVSTTRTHINKLLQANGCPNATQAAVRWQRERLLDDRAVAAALTELRERKTGSPEDRMRAALEAALAA